MALYTRTYTWNFNDGTKLILDASKPLVGNPNVYVVPVGESLLDIAKKFYGNHSSWHLIATANYIIDPYEDLVGTALIIPENG